MPAIGELMQAGVLTIATLCTDWHGGHRWVLVPASVTVMPNLMPNLNRSLTRAHSSLGACCSSTNM